jgi:kojibiose phosphorylase
MKEISENIYLPLQNNLLVQFDGYLSLKPTQELTLDAQGLPTIPADVLVADLGSTQYVKQPEIILLFLLLPGQYDQATINENFHFYDSKTLHKSSWSPPITSAVAAKLGFLDEAAHYLRLTLNTDLQNIFANSQEGNHAPAVGGCWVAMIHGFLGMSVLEDRMVINPKLPQNWDKVSCKLYYLDFYLHFTVEPRLLTVSIEPADFNFDRPLKSAITLQVGEQVMELGLDGRYPISISY